MEYLRFLKVWEESLKSQWARGVFAGDDIEGCALMNAEALGQVQVLRRIQEVDYEQYIEAVADDEEHIGAGSPGQSGSG